MNRMSNKLNAMALGFFWVLPAATYAAPGTLANAPLWLSDAVQHNVIVGIDDSGSMDFELLTTADDGVLWLNTDTGSFVDPSTETLYNTNVGTVNNRKTVYLFPNGANTAAYNGKKWLSSSNHYAVPPIKNYAFSRSPEYNKAYYDPSVTYGPWPTYGGKSFSDASVTATAFEPDGTGYTGGGTIDLFQILDTSDSDKGAEWRFNIGSATMVCDELGNVGAACGGTAAFERDYKYYPATYYLKQTTGTYTYEPAAAAVSTSNSVTIEAESGTYSSPFDHDGNLHANGTSVDRGWLNDAVADGASGNRFIGSLDSTTDAMTAPDFTRGHLSLGFEMPSTGGLADIWFRVYAPDGNHDSFWVNLNGYTSFSVTNFTIPPGLGAPLWVSDASSHAWNYFYTASSASWRWVHWGRADLPAGWHTLNLHVREGATLVDQVLVTTNTSYTPSGVVALSPGGPVPRDCATDIDPSHYRDFVANPTAYKDVDAIGLDGSCLKKYMITGTDTDPFTNGSAVTRTVLQEKQNFANWFTYYRRRHQSLRGGLAAAFNGITDINAGLFWIHGLSSNITMFDLSDPAQQTQFLTNNYNTVPLVGGTPLRSALKYAGDQYMRTDAAAPVTSECQKNFTLLFTDGYNTETGYSHTSILNADSGAGEPYQDGYSNTLADIAYKYYTTILRTDTGFPTGRVSVPAACSETSPDETLDCNANLHMNTFTVGLGAKGTIFGETHHDVADAYTTPPSWNTVNTSADKSQIDDLYHAAVNGRGEILNAESPDQLAQVMSDALSSIIATIGSGSGVTFNTSSLRTDSLIFTTLFNSNGWVGDVQARKLDSQTGDVSNTVTWSAATKLDARDLTTSPRVILTHNGSDGVPFQWANLAAAQQADLLKNSAGGDDSATDGENRLNYLRGSRAHEYDKTLRPTEVYRNRKKLLGDIVHSSPLYVGVPASYWPNKDPFGTEDLINPDNNNRHFDFKSKTLSNGGASNRTPVVYAGANDGMLHGFNSNVSGSNAGEEVLAYVPGSVYSTAIGQGLHYLTDPDYTHRYYVDLEPVAQDVFIKVSPIGTKDWRTILVGGAGAGAKGIFALDVTNPATFSESNAASQVLWEFTSAHDDDMGYVVSPPIIAMMENDKWAVIFGNGYESGGPTTGGSAKLMILFIEEGLDGTWSLGDYKEIDTLVGTPADRNGLSGVAVADMDGNYKADRVYAGDIKGNMWVFDLSSTTGAWVSAYTQGSTPKPLFTAKDGTTASAKLQPIVHAPNLALNTKVTGNNGENVLVAFGTGQYLVNSDTSDNSTQSFYVVWDHGSSNLDRSDLAARTLTLTGDTITSAGSAVAWTGGGAKDGWYFDFSSFGTTGERMNQKPILRSDQELGPVAIFTTVVPDDDECSQGGKSGIYGLPLFTGLNPGRAIVDLNGDGVIDSNDLGVGAASPNMLNEANILGSNIYSTKAVNEGEDSDTAELNKTGTDLESANSRTGRLGWHELVDEDF